MSHFNIYTSPRLDVLWLPRFRLAAFRVGGWRCVQVGRLAVEFRLGRFHDR